MGDLSRYSPDELRALRYRVDSLLATDGGPKIAAKTSPEDEVMEVLAAEFGRKGLTVHVLHRQSFWPKLKSASIELSEYLKKHAPVSASTVLGRKWAYRVMVRVMIDWMGERHIPLSPTSASNALPMLPALMDRAFPGYVESGVLEWVFKA